MKIPTGDLPDTPSSLLNNYDDSMMKELLPVMGFHVLVIVKKINTSEKVRCTAHWSDGLG